MVLAGMRVLVVDDNAVAREILTDTLRQFSLRVDSVSSGEAALEELAMADSEDPYRLVLMDWQMPGRNGLETSRSIRHSNLRYVPKILMITAFGGEDIRQQAGETEIEGFLQKPVSPSVLFDTLMNLFGVAADAAAAAGKQDRDLTLASGVRVLLVEDNEVNQQVATELLESEGASVTLANHGGEAVKLLTQGTEPPPFDVVLMDLQMPEMDGLTATRLLRAEPHLQQLPIIAMTAHAMAEEVLQCLDAGMNDHVGKPIDPRTLFATVARWTRWRHRDHAAAPVRTADGEGEDNLLEIEGVDVRDGLERMAGNKRLYRDLLTQFVAKQETTVHGISEALASGDRGQAERLAHSLKGVAGNLGVQQVFHSAGNLEKAIRDSQTGLEDLIRDLASVMDRQVQTIRAALLASRVSAGERREIRPADPGKAMAAMARLKELLEVNDADSSEAYATLANLLKGTVDTSRLEALGAAVKSYDFQAALVRLDQISKQFGAIEK
jgi:CheY-like chemotaxis protein